MPLVTPTFLGDWYKGSTAVSKTVSLGSNPGSPANKKYQRLRFGKCLTDVATASNPQHPLNVKMRKFINYLKESFVEMTKKVTWPSWDKLQNSAIVVMVASVIFALVIFGIDSFFQWLMSAIYTL